MMKLRFLVLLAVLFASACDRLNPFTSPTVASDAVTYQVFGTPGTGSALITYSTPTSVTQVTANINTPWQSGVIAGYGQFVAQKPTISVVAWGCATAQVLINAKVEVEKTGCGQPITVSATK